MTEGQYFSIAVVGILILAVFMLNYLEGGKLLRPHKWEIIQEDKVMIETRFNPLWGLGTIERKVIADVYRKKRRDGTYKYKTIPKS